MFTKYIPFAGKESHVHDDIKSVFHYENIEDSDDEEFWGKHKYTRLEFQQKGCQEDRYFFNSIQTSNTWDGDWLSSLSLL